MYPVAIPLTLARVAVTGAAALLLALAAATGGAAAQTSGASFVDQFDWLDPNRWYVSDGWSNGAHQNCTWSRQAVTTATGTLRLAFNDTDYGDRSYSCGEVQTKDELGHGTYEARLKTPRGPGLVGAFFTYIGPVHGFPHQEIDAEVLLKDPGKVQLNVYVNGTGGNEKLVPLPTPNDQAFIDYAFIWEPDRLRWYVNGNLVHTITDRAKIPVDPQKMYMSLWGSDTLSSWLGSFVDPGRPIHMEVDRVAFTRLGEACQFTGSVACQLTSGGGGGKGGGKGGTKGGGQGKGGGPKK